MTNKIINKAVPVIEALGIQIRENK